MKRSAAIIKERDQALKNRLFLRNSRDECRHYARMFPNYDLVDWDERIQRWEDWLAANAERVNDLNRQLMEAS